MEKRIVGFDLARALAVFGMVVVNFKIAMGAESGGPHWLLDVAGLLEGRAAATFVVLAGVGVTLIAGSGAGEEDPERLRRARSVLLKRALFLFAVGLLYTPIWPADILHFYGLYIVIGALLLRASRRRLLAAAATVAAVFVLLLLVLDYEKGWNWETLDYDGFWSPAGLARHLLFNGFHPVFPWAAFLLWGMVLGRLDLRAAVVRQRLVAWGLAIALAAEAASAALIHLVPWSLDAGGMEVVDALLGTGPMPPMPLYLVAAGGAATCVIGLCLELAERRPDAPLLRPLVATGQLALTLYVAHVVVGMGTLEALGRLEQQSAPYALGCAAFFCVASVAFAALWRSRFRRGPLEWVMRRVTGG